MTVKSAELRIGNWLLNFGKYHQIRDGEDIDDADRNECFQAISLTGELLVELGFTHSPSHQVQYYIDDFVIIEEGRSGYTLFGSEWTIGNSFKYVHQLQNLYWCLYGKELEINWSSKSI